MFVFLLEQLLSYLFRYGQWNLSPPVVFHDEDFKCFHLFWQRTDCCLMVGFAFLGSGMPEALQPHFVPYNNNLA